MSFVFLMLKIKEEEEFQTARRIVGIQREKKLSAQSS